MRVLVHECVSDSECVRECVCVCVCVCVREREREREIEKELFGECEGLRHFGCACVRLSECMSCVFCGVCVCVCVCV